MSIAPCMFLCIDMVLGNVAAWRWKCASACLAYQASALPAAHVPQLQAQAIDPTESVTQ